MKGDTQESEAEMLYEEIDELGERRGTALRVARSTGERNEGLEQAVEPEAEA